MRRLIAYAFVLSLTAFSVQAEASVGSESSVSLMHFRTNALFAMNAAGESISGQVSWVPELRLGPGWLRPTMGASVFKSSLDTNFVVGEAGALYGIGVIGLELEAGGGVQTWLGKGTWPFAAGNVVLPISNKWFGLIDRAFLGYAALLQGGSITNEVKLGAGVAF